MGDFEPQDPEDEEDLPVAAHAGAPPSAWRGGAQQPETQATLAHLPFPPPGDGDDAFGEAALHGDDDPDAGEEPPVDPEGGELAAQLRSFIMQLDGIEQALEVALNDAFQSFKDKVAQVKAAAELYVDTRLRVAEEVRQGTETVNQKLQRLRIGLQAQLNVGDG